MSFRVSWRLRFGAWGLVEFGMMRKIVLHQVKCRQEPGPWLLPHKSQGLVQGIVIGVGVGLELLATSFI